MSDSTAVERDAASREAQKRLSEAAARHPSFLACSLELGDVWLFPRKDIKDVHFQFLDDRGQVMSFEVFSQSVGSTTGGAWDFELNRSGNGLVGVCSNHRRTTPGFRGYLLILTFRGSRPKALGVRLTGDGDDDCRVELRANGTTLLTVTANGTTWQQWDIPGV